MRPSLVFYEKHPLVIYEGRPSGLLKEKRQWYSTEEASVIFYERTFCFFMRADPSNFYKRRITDILWEKTYWSSVREDTRVFGERRTSELVVFYGEYHVVFYERTLFGLLRENTPSHLRGKTLWSFIRDGRWSSMREAPVVVYEGRPSNLLFEKALHFFFKGRPPGLLWDKTLPASIRRACGLLKKTFWPSIRRLFGLLFEDLVAFYKRPSGLL